MGVAIEEENDMTIEEQRNCKHYESELLDLPIKMLFIT